MKPSEILRKARDIIKKRGLARNAYEDGKGRCCMIGALRVAVHGSVDPPQYGPDDTVYGRSARYLAPRSVDPFITLASFSDSHDKKAVINRFNKAIARAKAARD